MSIGGGEKTVQQVDFMLCILEQDERNGVLLGFASGAADKTH